MKRCRYCGKNVPAGNSRRKYCSHACKVNWWHRNHPSVTKNWKRKNKDRWNLISRRSYWKIRRRVLDLLGGKCVVCGIDDIRILQVNHLRGDGGDSRKRHGSQRSGDQTRLFREIVDGSLPREDFDIRCANHNILYEYELGRRSIPADSH